MTQLKMINMEDVEIEEVEWLWQDFIPYRKITILQGDSGEGKTTALLQIIASLTTGREIVSARDDPPVREPVNVIYQTAEDGLGDTIKPRLVAAGADCSRVLAPLKSSLTYEPTAVAFRLSRDYGFEWIGEYDITPDELLSGSSRGKKTKEATEFLKRRLADGMMPSKNLYEEAEAEGIRKKTLRNAMADLHTEAIRDGDKWYTALPEDD